MDQIKIGKFIADCRKEAGMTQAVLAEKLGISDRAVSKWETGRALPDAGIMLEVCNLLKINVNELLSGEKIMTESYNKKAEENLLAMKKELEEKNSQMPKTEYLIAFPAVIAGLVMVFVASFSEMPSWLRIALIAFAFMLIFTVAFIAVGIEQKAGYYQCSKCGTKRIPSFTETLFAPHLGRSRFMKCQSCQKYHWHGKVVSADSEVSQEETKNFSQKINKQKNKSLIAGITVSALCFLLVIAFIMTVYLSSKNIPLNVHNGSLSIKSLFYPTEIPVEQIETEDVRVINLADEDLKMNLRINGIGLPNCRLGWYKSAGQKYKLYVTDKTNVVFIPTKDGYTILYSSPDAQKIVENIKSGVNNK